MSEFILHVSDTANGYKSLIPLEEFGCDYQLNILDLSAGEQYQPDFMKISPLGRIPVLEAIANAPALTVYGSEAIAIYLAERYGKSDLDLVFSPIFPFQPTQISFTPGELKIGRCLERNCPTSLSGVPKSPAHCNIRVRCRNSFP